MLKTHYRSPVDWTVKALEESARTMDDWYRVAADAQAGEPADAVIEALSDDLNTPQMIAALHALRSKAASGQDGDRAAFAARCVSSDSSRKAWRNGRAASGRRAAVDAEQGRRT